MTVSETEIVAEIGSDYDKYGFHDPENYVFKSRRGLTPEIGGDLRTQERAGVDAEVPPEVARVLPRAAHAGLGANLSDIDFENIYYYIKPTEKQAKSWDDLPSDIKQTWDRLGIPEAEKKYSPALARSTSRKSSTTPGGARAPGCHLPRHGLGPARAGGARAEYFGTVIPQNDNKFAALNSAVWSGGSFIYVPPGVRVEMPLQAYFRINAENMGQFERTLIIVDEGAYVHYVEGCTAPIYSTDSLHSAVVEIIVKKVAAATRRFRTGRRTCTTSSRSGLSPTRTRPWSGSTAILGSKVTMKYPAIWLMGERAHGEVLSIAFAGEGQHQDAGGKCVHVAPNTSSVINSKSISKNGGRAGYRGLLEVAKGATGAKSKVACDALILDEASRSDTYPYIRVDESRGVRPSTRRPSRRSARSSSSI